MNTKRLPTFPGKTSRENTSKTPELAEVGLAAIASYKKQKELSDFTNFLLGALDRNSNWLNTLVGKQSYFKCALMVGAGPNRFQLQEVIYPADGDINLEVEMKDSEDYDKVAITAMVKLTSLEIDNLLKYLKTHLGDNNLLKKDLLKGKGMGISFAVLRPISENSYRVMERIVIGNNLKCETPDKKRQKKDDKFLHGSPFKKMRKVT